LRLIAILALTLFVFSTLPAGALTWTTTTVDASAGGAHSTTLKLDQSGRAHIGYVGGASTSDWAVKYAVSNGTPWDLTAGSSWSTDDVAIGSYASMDVTAGGTPHFSYRGEEVGVTTGTLQYATGSIGSWNTALVHSGGFPSYTGSSLALDNDDTPHIAFLKANGAEHRYASLGTGGAWSDVLLGSGIYWASTGRDMVFDSDNNMQIAYTTRGGNEAYHVRYAKFDNLGTTNLGSSTLFTWVGGDPKTSFQDIAIDVGANDRPHVAYGLGSIQNYTGKEGLHYYRWQDADSSWHDDIVYHAGQQVVLPFSVVLDWQDTAHFLFWEHGLYYGRLNESGLIGTPELIPDAGHWGQGATGSLAIDDSGAAHIAFVSVSGSELNYAWAPDAAPAKPSGGEVTPELPSGALLILSALPIGLVWWRRNKIA